MVFFKIEALQDKNNQGREIKEVEGIFKVMLEL